MPRLNNVNGTSRKFSTQTSLDSYGWSICDILRRSNSAGALQCTAEINECRPRYYVKRLQMNFNPINKEGGSYETSG